MSKLTREDKIEIYERRKKGETISSLVKAFNICESNIKYLITLIEKYGNNILRKDKNRVYSKEFKLQAINRILINHESINSVALDIGLVSAGILHNWLSKFKENGYNVVEKKKGRKTKSMTKPKKNDKELSEKEKIKKLEEENLYLKAENEYLKKLRALVQERELKEKKKLRVIAELRAKYPFKILLKIAGISRSVYYYYIDKKDIDEKNKDIIEKIKEIYYANKRRYGYRRVTLELKNQGFNINHKKVQRLMKKLNLQSIIRKKRKYSSYKGQVGKIADDHIKRDFEATAPNQKWFTDVTEFNLRGEKLYLSPILDAYGRYIVSYDVSRSPNLEQINHMLNLAFKENKDYENLIFHSDQGWQYQHNSYQERLKEKKIIQSMSRKGNSLDNGLMECFFGLLKSEMFYEQEEKYKTLEELKEAIEDYIYYYNNKRIKEKLKGLTPASYRSQSLLVS
ncbi:MULTISPECIES: IS3 family transposase [Fusobacterium]|nr:IS3 family transposase [Fusobacterium nucleatum]WDD87983.1 IS3 family transposase [Fusobacterium nucleatum]WDD88566.1 IS3 family transposase [Fusobacterium nucleatum]WDD88585.1 IS3 family transposase [Fusobacterium nucleatum]WDD89236.1 IS3 family transposase [Fusobacterium nucleatum]WDD90046.1 IS3 family transposase [Fusobacterium nucleatum]